MCHLSGKYMVVLEKVPLLKICRLESESTSESEIIHANQTAEYLIVIMDLTEGRLVFDPSYSLRNDIKNH